MASRAAPHSIRFGAATCYRRETSRSPAQPGRVPTFSQLVVRAELIEVLREADFGNHARATCIVDEMRAEFGMDSRLRELAGRGASVAEAALVQQERDATAGVCAGLSGASGPRDRSPTPADC